jgi:hypothetical protein
LEPVSIQKAGQTLAFFFLYLSNRNRGKAFAILSLKNNDGTETKEPAVYSKLLELVLLQAWPDSLSSRVLFR